MADTGESVSCPALVCEHGSTYFAMLRATRDVHRPTFGPRSLCGHRAKCPLEHGFSCALSENLVPGDRSTAPPTHEAVGSAAWPRRSLGTCHQCRVLNSHARMGYFQCYRASAFQGSNLGPSISHVLFHLTGRPMEAVEFPTNTRVFHFVRGGAAEQVRLRHARTAIWTLGDICKRTPATPPANGASARGQWRRPPGPPGHPSGQRNLPWPIRQ